MEPAALEDVEAFIVVETGDGGTEWYRPTGRCRGPWDAGACHAGPPTGLLARAAERLIPDQQLVRLTVDLTRPIPHAGFGIEAEIARSGRTVSTTDLAIVDEHGKRLVTARGMHLAPTDPGDVPTTSYGVVPVEHSVPDRFPLQSAAHDSTMFSDGVEVRYPPGEAPTPGPTTLWMRTVPLVFGEDASPFQRICALADCGNGISRNADPDDLVFMNTDLTVLVHRPPIGEWFGIESVSRWEASGVGMSDSLLFDAQGAVGRALQALVIRRR